MFYLFLSLIYFISKFLTASSIIIIVRYLFFWYRSTKRGVILRDYLNQKDDILALTSIIFLFTLFLL